MDNSGFLERANLLLSQGRPKDAESWAKKALETDPDDPDALAVLARCYMDQKRFGQSIELLQKAIAIDPADSHLFYLLAFAHYQNDVPVAAEQYIKQAIEMAPYHGAYFGLLAYILIGERRFKDALEKANEGLALDAENITCLNARSTALNKLKFTDDAIATMQDALSKDPDNEFTHTTIGWNLLEKGKHTDAQKHFREALRINPGLENAKQGLKEAMKSKIPPYRWLLQFGFWLQNKGKSFRWIFLIGLYVLVRLIVSLTMKNKETENIGFLIGGAYLLFVGMSWIINPLANAFLLFHRDGKFALTEGEKWNAKAFMACIALGGFTLLGAYFFTAGIQQSNLLTAGLILLSLSVPAGHTEFPVRLKEISWGDGLALGMGVMAVASVAGALLYFEHMVFIFVTYFILFVLYTWVKSIGSR